MKSLPPLDLGKPRTKSMEISTQDCLSHLNAQKTHDHYGSQTLWAKVLFVFTWAYENHSHPSRPWYLIHDSLYTHNMNTLMTQSIRELIPLQTPRPNTLGFMGKPSTLEPLDEDPHKHLKDFHVVCSTMRPHGILQDYIKMKAFPFSLDGDAKD
ncbi:hypothetical protein CR513_20992, partial [Mucuna pruriens]